MHSRSRCQTLSAVLCAIVPLFLSPISALSLSDASSPHRPLFTASLPLGGDHIKGALLAGRHEMAKAFKGAESFIFGACGGAVGAAVMYPGEAIKMRMQALGAQARFDVVLRSALIHEGIGGLYKGLQATVAGVAPEKAIMFGVQAYGRKLAKPFEDERGVLPLHLECAIGAVAGTGQVLFSSPKEMIMIQMQMASQEGMQASINNPIMHIRRLGLSKLYQGCSGTFLRDIPFAAIFFGLNSRVKLAMLGDRDRLNFFETLLAATAAALPASFLTTPCDVMKTRLQAAAGRAGGVRLSIPAIASQIYKTEGLRGFFVGATVRVGLKAPNLAVAMVVVEVLTQLARGTVVLPSFKV